MNGIKYALRRIHNGENEITKDLLQIAERHRVDHEVHHVTRDMAKWSEEHVRILAEHAVKFDLDLDAEPETPHNVMSSVRQAMSTAIGRRPQPGGLLMEDLHRLYLRASENSLAWEMLAQIAQAKHNHELLELSRVCHPQTLRQIRWANTMIKTLSPQLLASM